MRGNVRIDQVPVQSQWSIRMKYLPRWRFTFIFATSANSISPLTPAANTDRSFRCIKEPVRSKIRFAIHAFPGSSNTKEKILDDAARKQKAGAYLIETLKCCRIWR